MLLRSAAAPWGPLSLGLASSAPAAPWGPTSLGPRRHQHAPLPGDRRLQGRHATASSARVAPAPPPPPPPRGEAGAGSGSGSPQPHESSAPQPRPRPPTLRASAGNPKSPPAAASWFRGPPPALRHSTALRGHVGPGEAGGGSYFCFRQGAPAQAFRCSLSYPSSALWASVSPSLKGRPWGRCGAVQLRRSVVSHSATPMG